MAHPKPSAHTYRFRIFKELASRALGVAAFGLTNERDLDEARIRSGERKDDTFYFLLSLRAALQLKQGAHCIALNPSCEVAGAIFFTARFSLTRSLPTTRRAPTSSRRLQFLSRATRQQPSAIQRAGLSQLAGFSLLAAASTQKRAHESAMCVESGTCSRSSDRPTSPSQTAAIASAATTNTSPPGTHMIRPPSC